MFSWIQLRLIAPLALIALATLAAGAAATGFAASWPMAIVLGGSLSALVLWSLGIRSHDRAVRDIRLAAEAVIRDQPVGDFEVQNRPDELGELARDMRRASRTLRERAEARELERDELRVVLQSIEEGLIAVDPDLRVVLWSPLATHLLGLQRGPEAGTPLVDAIAHGELIRVARRSLDSCRPEAGSAPLFGGPDGDLRVELNATPLLRAGRVDGVVLALRDVTTRLAHQRARRIFAANVSHELRTPLALVKGFLETLQDGALADAEKGPRFLGIAHRHVLGLEALVNDLLTLLTLEGRTEPRPQEPVSVDQILLRVVTGFEELAASSGLEVVGSVEEGAPQALGHPDLVERAIRNLIENALKYSDGPGRVEARLRAGDDGVMVEVTDNGIGIPRKDQPHIFARFYRVDKSRSRERGGTGLGLSIVKEIMDLERGRVSVESVPGRGSTFRLWFQPVPGKSGS